MAQEVEALPLKLKALIQTPVLPKKKVGGANLKYIVRSHVNITMYPPVQLLYANNLKFFKLKRTAHMLKCSSIQKCCY
jgi:hypothetical protein